MRSADPDLEFVADIVRSAGVLVMESFRQQPEVRKKGVVDLVTDADLASERFITSAISAAYPDHAILAEETPEESAATTANPSPYLWVIDPLDGTTNFVHGLPLFAVSIGLRYENRTQLGVVYNPADDELFAATLGGGATLNGEPITVSQTAELLEALFVTGFPYGHDEIFHGSFELWHRMYNISRGGRRLGAAALDCCYVAAGRFDVFYEANLKPWDICAGELICREAGGVASDWSGGPLPFDGHRVLLSNGHLHQAVMDVLAEDAFEGLQ